MSLLSCAAQVFKPSFTQMRFPLLSAFQATEPCVSGLVKTRAETIKRLKRNKALGLCEKRSSSKAETSTKLSEANDSHHSVCSSSTSLRIETQTRCQIKSSERGSGRYLPDCRIALSGESADTHLSKSAVPLYCQAGARLQRQRVHALNAPSFYEG